jgi:hypothetical protein
MRALSGAKVPEKEADPIIVHPAIRHMLLTQKAFAEGGRALVYFLAFFADIVEVSTDQDAKKAADDMLSFLTPIAKAFLTEMGYQCANHGVQIYGGHGFIQEWGMEQIVRDTRIACIYEGTTEIQSLDLLGRKVLQTQGKLLRQFTKVIHKFCEQHAGHEQMKPLIDELAQLNQEWGDLTMRIGMKAMQNPEEAAAAAVDYMYYSGYVTLAYLWAKMASTAYLKLTAGTSETSFYEAKIKTAEFYYAKLLPQTRAHVARIDSGLQTLMALDEEQFAF